MARSAHLHTARLITRHGASIKARPPNTWSKTDRMFIKRYYPDFYRHAYPGGGGSSSGSGAGRSGYPLIKPALSTPETVGLPFPIDHAVEEAYKINARGTTPGQEQEWKEITKHRNPNRLGDWVKEILKFYLPGVETHMNLGDVVQTGDIRVTKQYRWRDFHKDLLRRTTPRTYPEPPPDRPDTDDADGDNNRRIDIFSYGLSIQKKKRRYAYKNKLATGKKGSPGSYKPYRRKKSRHTYSSYYQRWNSSGF